MSKMVPVEDRQDIFYIRKSGLYTAREVAELYGVTVRTVELIMREYRGKANEREKL